MNAESERWLRFAHEDLRVAELALQDNTYNIPTRYPGALPGMLPEGLPDRLDAEQALDTARQVLAMVTVLVEKGK